MRFRVYRHPMSFIYRFGYGGVKTCHGVKALGNGETAYGFKQPAYTLYGHCVGVYHDVGRAGIRQIRGIEGVEYHGRMVAVHEGPRFFVAFEIFLAYVFDALYQFVVDKSYRADNRIVKYPAPQYIRNFPEGACALYAYRQNRR